MNRKQLTLILVLGVVLGGLAWRITRHHLASFQSSGASLGQKLLPNFPLNDVAQIAIREGTNELKLVRQDDLWKVSERQGYAANFSQVGDLLRKMWELKAVGTEDVGPSQYARLQLLDPAPGTNSATLVEFKDASGKAVASVLLGKKHVKKSDAAPQFGGGEGWPAGRWLRVQGGAKQVALVSEVFSEIEAKPERWLNKDFLKVEKLRSVSVTHTNATNSWKVFRETENGELKLADAQGEEKLDTGKSSSVGSALSYPSFTDIAPADAKPEDVGLDKPIEAKLETFDGFHYDVKIGRKSGEEKCYLKISVSADLPKERPPGKDEKPEDKDKLDKEFKETLSKQEEKLKAEKSYERWTYLVDKYTVDALLKERKDLLADKKDEKKDAAAAADVKPGETPPMPAADANDEDEKDADPKDPDAK
jgi:hypothetical protein